MPAAVFDLPPLPGGLGPAARGLMGTLAIPNLANPGLCWERYPRVFRGEQPLQAEQHRDFLLAFVAAFRDQSSHQGPALAAFHTRMGALAGSRSHRVKTNAAFATGLGADHTVENGLTFDRLLGVPYLPGSGLKGLCRAGANLSGASPEERRAVLGGDPPGLEAETEGPPTQGSVCFLGAWPSDWPRLKVELLNPHHPAYQDDQGKAPERRTRVADYTEEPKPVPFLAVDVGVPFTLYLRPTGRGAGSAVLDKAREWLELGFDWLGAGGKTAAGMGRFTWG